MKILIVNDSPVLTAVIKAIVEGEQGLKVIATASNGKEAVHAVTRYLPDLVLMDIHMPKMGGVEATRQIMLARPKTRILITSATIKRNMKHIFDTLQYGALDYVRSPSLSYAPGTAVTPDQLSVAGTEMLRKVHTVLRISDKKVIDNKNLYESPSEKSAATAVVGRRVSVLRPRLLSIGCSTGGPTTVAMLLSHLYRPFPAPILICQHIDAEFTQGFASWLTEQTGLKVSIARHQMQPESGQVYMAPGGDMNLEISAAGRLMLTTPKPDQIYLPNINQLFFSMAEYLGKGACGVVLTG
ncbi:MAG: response regulator, partial [Gammaproteobacteria bacterium]|nr:response regulator [Gammaproteobacteria bacterium]